MRILLVLLITIAAALPRRAAAEARHLAYRGVSYTIYTFDPAETVLRLFWRDGDTGRFRNAGGLVRWAAAHRRRLVFATNAGMYEPNREPVGLLISDGRLIKELNTREGAGNFYLKPNGIFLLQHGAAQVLDAQQYSSQGRPALATQSGPLLVINNVLHPKFLPDSDSRLIRSGVGVCADGAVSFAISDDPVNFYDFALLFRDGLRCQNALYLDGVVSRMYLPALGRFETDGDFSAVFAVFED